MAHEPSPGMAHWLVKEEPTHYAFEELVRDGSTEWSGVHNALALRHIRSMRPGDDGVYYHSGEVRAAVGLFRVLGAPYEDTSDPRGSWAVRIGPVRPLRRPIPMPEIRADPAFAGFDLVRISRLSVVPVSAAHWSRLLRLERSAAPAQSKSSKRRSSRSSAGPRQPGSA
ncbi:MAG: EVE domain-containing protein [Thermoplasmata archaeon]|nr:EVE domain-containing protein [Thermoplasmata archaeon]